MDQGFVKHMSIGLYFRWDNLKQRYIWAEYPITGLPPQRPGQLRDDWHRNYDPSFDPFMQYIIDWGFSKGQKKILDVFYGSGGWEKWVHPEMQSDLQHFVDRYHACFRETGVYANAPKQKADLLLNLEPEIPGQPLSVLLELKVELVRNGHSRASEFMHAVSEDIRKIQVADLYSLVPNGDCPTVGRPCHAYAVALTVTDEGDKAMTQLNMTLETSRQRQGEACPFNVWWFRRVVD